MRRRAHAHLPDHRSGPASGPVRSHRGAPAGERTRPARRCARRSDPPGGRAPLRGDGGSRDPAEPTGRRQFRDPGRRCRRGRAADPCRSGGGRGRRRRRAAVHRRVPRTADPAGTARRAGRPGHGICRDRPAGQPRRVRRTTARAGDRGSREVAVRRPGPRVHHGLAVRRQRGGPARGGLHPSRGGRERPDARLHGLRGAAPPVTARGGAHRAGPDAGCGGGRRPRPLLD